jgi:RHS repeat-associated protein
MRNVGSGAIFYYAEDMLGSSRSLLQDGQSTLCYDADLYPYGGEIAYINTCPQNYKFEGKERDTETGDDNFGARYYSSHLGRWLSADWSSVPSPVPYANLTNPQTLNLYAMVSDNPETFADLDGHSAVNPTSPLPSSSCEGSQPACPDSQDPAGDQVKQKEQTADPNKTEAQSGSGTAQQGQSQQDKDKQQYKNEVQKREEQFREKQEGPKPGSPEYLKQLSSKITTETDAEKKYILAPAAAMEAVGLGAIAATSAAAGNALATVDTATTKAGVWVEVNVRGGMAAATDYTRGLLSPKTPPPSIPGLFGAATRDVINIVTGNHL